MRTTTTPRPRRAALVLAAGALLATGATACERTPPPMFTVAVDATGPDLDPGDGTCATAADACSLQAAVEEANALDRKTTINVPDGAVASVDLEVTGTIDLVAAETWQDLGEVRITVAEGAQLDVDDADIHSVTVNGRFHARRVGLGDFAPSDPRPAAVVAVGATGRAFLANVSLLGWLAPAIDNAGTALVFNSTVMVGAVAETGDVAAVTTHEGGRTGLLTSAFLGGDGAVDTCGGLAPTSFGYNLTPDATCGPALEGDVQDVQETSIQPGPDSVRIDAIPVGTHQCGEQLTDDISGPDRRPVDGDGDSTAACDIGAHELRPR